MYAIERYEITNGGHHIKTVVRQRHTVIKRRIVKMRKSIYIEADYEI